MVDGWIIGKSAASAIHLRLGDKIFNASEKNIFRQDVSATFSGFRIPVTVEPVQEEKDTEVSLHAAFRDGSVFEQPLGVVKFRKWNKRNVRIDIPASIDRENLLVICMTTYNPDRELFQRQIESIRNQTFKNWLCIVSDDHSSEAGRSVIREVLNGDGRFFLIEHEENKGFYHNFERCLEYVPEQAKYIALADQDDYWYPNKLEECVGVLKRNERCQLVYCDMRIVDREGNVLSDTYWKHRKNYYKPDDLDLLTLANTVTGAASVFRAELLEDILPFPPRYGELFHDHWIAVIASAKGGIEYVNQPLYDYVQTSRNVIGHTDFGYKTIGDSVREYLKTDAPNIRFILDKIRKAVVGLYNYKHRNARHIEAIVYNALLRDLDPRSRELILRSQSVTGLMKVHRKVTKNKETLNNLQFYLLFSILLNKLTHNVWLPLRGWVGR